MGYLLAQRRKDLAEAERLVLRALELRPDTGAFLDSLGWVYFQRGEYQRAVEALERASLLEPDEPVILEHLGDAYQRGLPAPRTRPPPGAAPSRCWCWTPRPPIRPSQRAPAGAEAEEAVHGACGPLSSRPRYGAPRRGLLHREGPPPAVLDVGSAGHASPRARRGGARLRRTTLAATAPSSTRWWPRASPCTASTTGATAGRMGAGASATSGRTTWTTWPSSGSGCARPPGAQKTFLLAHSHGGADGGAAGWQNARPGGRWRGWCCQPPTSSWPSPRPPRSSWRRAWSGKVVPWLPIPNELKPEDLTRDPAIARNHRRGSALHPHRHPALVHRVHPGPGRGAGPGRSGDSTHFHLVRIRRTGWPLRRRPGPSSRRWARPTRSSRSIPACGTSRSTSWAATEVFRDISGWISAHL